MKEIQFQTPHRDQTSVNRRSKSTPDLLRRNLQKVAKKSLGPEFTAVLEAESAEVDTPPASETITASNLTSPSSTITCDENVVFNASNNKCEISRTNSMEKMESIEAQLVINCLQEAKIEVLKSKDLGHSRDILDALIDYIIGELCDGVYQDKKWRDRLRLRKVNMVFLAFMPWILVIFAIWFFSLGSKGIITGPLPT